MHPFLSKLADSWPAEAWQDVTVLVAVSGGADSVALLRGLVELRKNVLPESRHSALGRLVMGHFNHGLRGREADDDARFVADLAAACKLDFHLGQADVQSQAAKEGDGIEAAARSARYAFLQAKAEALGARYVVTAHTADDQAETILHRILRGTGLAGLAGMPRTRPLGPAVTLLRPLLNFRRNELLAWLADIGQPFRTDASNHDQAFTRNRLRQDLIPKLSAEYNPQVIEALLRLGSLAGEGQAAIDTVVENLERCAVTFRKAERVEIDVRALEGKPRYLVRELLIAVWRGQAWPLQGMGFEQWDMLAELMTCEGAGKLMLPGAVLAEAREGRLALECTSHFAR